MNAPTLETIGETLFGPSWVGALADALGVNRRTIERWRPDNYIPPHAWAKLAEIADKRAHEQLDLGAVCVAMAKKIDG